MGNGIVSALVLLAVTVLSGCATSLINSPKNQPLRPCESTAANTVRAPQDVGGETMAALFFSGGGLRAAAFSFGVLQGLGQQRAKSGAILLDGVTFITSVSGGSITAVTKNWQDEIIRFRFALPTQRKAAIIAQNANWRCDDVAFTVTQITFGDLGEKEETALSAIPTRLKLPTEKIDQLISAGLRAVASNPVFAGFCGLLNKNRPGFEQSRSVPRKTSDGTAHHQKLYFAAKV
jgi:hypothetical protein